MDPHELTKVLLIDPDPAEARVVEEFLTRSGSRRFRLTAVRSIDDLSDGRAGNFDVVVLDLVHNPAADLARLLKAFPVTPVVVMADADGEDDAVDAVNGGALEYLIKGKDLGPQFRRVLRSAVDRKRTEERARHLAHHDPITGLPNRGLFRTLLEGSLARARRNNTLVALLFLDIDHFKWVNESYAHRTGDALLSCYAKRIRTLLRESDIVAHMGGDEFAVILEGLKSIDAATLVASKILETANVPLEVDGHTIFLTTSIGIAVYPTLENDTPDSLATSADIAMYNAKELGRNSYQIFTPEMYPECTDRVRIDAELRAAILRNEFVLHYQPQIDLATGRLCGIEALIRWQHPKHGLLFPGDFIKVAEDSGAIVSIGEWVLRRSCADLAGLRRVGHHDLRIAVNISPLQFRQDRLAGIVAGILAEHGIPPTQVELELTESTLIENTDRSHRILESLKSMGMRISIDDFGTGYSSLAYLQHFPIDSLKIDRSFINGLGRDAGSDAITQAVVSLAHALHLTVIAEGVETENQHQLLHRLGCEVAQGFLFSRPMPLADVTRILDKVFFDPTEVASLLDVL